MAFWNDVAPWIKDVIQASAVLLAAIIVAVAVRIVFTRLARKCDRCESALLDDLFRSMRLPAVLAILLAGVFIALTRVQAGGVSAFVLRQKDYFAAGIWLIIVIAASRAAQLAFVWYERQVTHDTGVRPQTGLLRKVAVLVVWVIGIVQILSQFNVKFGTLLASLGIAGLAIGLALQDTIANLFAGFYLVMDRSVRAGDYIKLDSGEEGFVEQVGWRNTRIRLWANNIVLVPNAKLVQTIITNMTLPNNTLSVYTWCGVSYDSDLEQVEEVTKQVAAEIINKVDGADLSYDPVVRFKEFADSNITFVVVFRASEVSAQYLLQHEFIKALHKRFKQEQIEISYPVSKLVWEKGNSFPVEHVSSNMPGNS